MQAGKVARGFAALESATLPLDATPHVGQIALACALGYQDLRFKGEWRSRYPKLVAWLDRFAAQVPAFAATKVAAVDIVIAGRALARTRNDPSTNQNR